MCIRNRDPTGSKEVVGAEVVGDRLKSEKARNGVESGTVNSCREEAKGNAVDRTMRNLGRVSESDNLCKKV